jgi:hypothetical protein
VAQNQIIAVYGNGLFGQNDPTTNNAQLAQIKASQFNSVILWSVHVHDNGDLYYNDTPLVTGGTLNPALTYMQSYVAALKQRGQVWWSVGSWGANDFGNIGKLLKTPQGRETLTSNFGALLKAMPADGIDFDMEESYDAEMQTTIVQFTLLLGRSLKTSATYCPYMDEPFWLNCLADVFAQNGSQVVQRFNLQCYAGGGGNTTAGWYKTLASFSRPLGIASPSTFISPSNWVQPDGGGQVIPPAAICAFFAQTQMRENAGGGFLWNTSEIFGSGNTAAAYAQAVVNGLANKCS